MLILFDLIEKESGFCLFTREGDYIDTFKSIYDADNFITGEDGCIASIALMRY